MSDGQKNKIGRRAFFGALGGAAAGAAALTATGASATETTEEATKARYQESEHVKTFYRVNGYETKN